jgi:hypothetical protein
MSNNWISLKDKWDYLRGLADKRDNQKRRYRSTKNWSNYSTHFLGLCGEYTFSLLTGVEFDAELKVKGDPGYDFIIAEKTVSVKTTQYWRDPHLKEYLSPKHFCDFYFLMGVDIEERRCKMFGWASRKEVEAAELIDYGYGQQRVIKHGDLHRYKKLVK